MKILIAGGTGFIGRSLIPVLLKNGHQLTVVTRDINQAHTLWGDSVSACTWDQLNSNDIKPDDIDSVINLAGKNIADQRWSYSVKQKLKESRTLSTTKIIDWINHSISKKPHLYNASAIGIYGATTTAHALSKALTEVSSNETSSDFCSELGQEWEGAAKLALKSNIPLTLLRFAVVLKRKEGILKKLEPQFHFGLGSIIGSGDQSFSWVHIDDLVEAIIFLLERPDITGPVNICAPNSLAQKDFANSLAKAMNRPCLVTLPAFLIKILFGKMGDELLLSGQNIYPGVLLNKKFEFSYPEIETALRHEWMLDN